MDLALKCHINPFLKKSIINNSPAAGSGEKVKMGAGAGTLSMAQRV